MINYISKNIASLWGLGEKTKFPGTLASFVSLFFSFLSYYFFNKSIHIILFFIFVTLGLWAIYKIHAVYGGHGYGQKDYSWIVIDEWIGMWLVSFFLFEINVSLTQNIVIALGAFAVFRVIDILKFIPPIGIIDRTEKQTAVLVILDDIIAGCYSYAILMIVFGFYNMHYIYLSFLFLLPAMIANMTPVLLRGIKKFEKPINIEVFGENKTWRGLLGGIFFGTLTYYVLAKIGFIREAQNISYIIFVGFLLSFGALAGDLIKSYFKRRIGIKEGEAWIPWDQIDYCLGVIIITYPFYNSPKEIILMLIIGGTMSALAHRFAYLMKIINTKW